MMIIFIEDGTMDAENFERLEKYIKETNSGIVISVTDMDDIKVEKE